MKITLQTTRQVLREALGFESFTASFIRQVVEDTNRPTAGITEEGRLAYNPAFVRQHVHNQEDLFCMVFHELLHPMFGHFIYASGPIENLAADAIINAVISRYYSQQSRQGSLFRKFYKNTDLEGLLRPESNLERSRYAHIYARLYPGYQYLPSGQALTTGELIQTLKVLIDPPKLSSITLVGSHESGSPATDESEGFPKETLERIADDLRRSIREAASQHAGHGNELLEMVLEALRTHLSMRRVLLQRFTTQRKVDQFKERLHVRRVAVSPVPIHPSKRDMTLISAGLYPGHFHNTVQHPHVRHKGLAIYLDVSGSVNTYLPKILGILSNLRREITSVFLFSNKVVETTMSALQKGQLQTTYGTDFDCIAESILERGFDKAIIMTDGYASMNEEHCQQLKASGLSTLCVLFDRAQSCSEFASFGDVVLLEDLCE